jgi:hypothetical protein
MGTPFGQQLVQFFSGRPDSLVGQGRGDIQFPRDTPGVLLLEVEQGQRQTKLLRQTPNGSLKIVVLPGLVCRDRLGLDAQRLGTLAPPEQIDAQVPRNPQNSRLEPLRPGQVPDVQKTLQQGLLGDVLGIVDVGQHAEAQGKNVPVVPFRQHRVGCLIAAPAGAKHALICTIVHLELQTLLP